MYFRVCKHALFEANLSGNEAVTPSSIRFILVIRLRVLYFFTL